ncbi:MAG: GerMN domain-containing protein [Selenomonadaceae bacterium]|nr:GerMN domain-containing protein [Selenomonadaceae bacterium]
MLALLLFATGCEQPPPENPPASPSEPVQNKPEVKPETKPEQKPAEPATDNNVKSTGNQPAKNEKNEQSMNVKVYYPDDSGMKLVEVSREIIVDGSTDKYTAAVETLMQEPSEENLTRIFPKNAALRSVKVREGLATVDFDGSILKGFVGGSTGEEFLIGSIVDTLTNFPEVKRVKFLVDGKEIETLSGHMDLSTPLERMGNLTE